MSIENRCLHAGTIVHTFIETKLTRYIDINISIYVSIGVILIEAQHTNHGRNEHA